MDTYRTEAATLVVLGLAGGQGKTTVGMMVGRMLARAGIAVLMVDADPQASLTAFLGVEPAEDRPTLLEVLMHPEKKVPLYSAIVPVSEGLYLIPANDQLESANHHLAASGMSLKLLRNRLYQVGEKLDASEKIAHNFGCIIVDPPPERSHLALTALGAGNLWTIPAEANVKGVQSLRRTTQLVETYQPMLPQGELVGVMPFRARWVGLNPTSTTKQSMQVMKSLVGAEKMLPHLLESDVYKRAINEQVLPRDLGHPELEYPLWALIERLKPAMGEAAKWLEIGERV